MQVAVKIPTGAAGVFADQAGGVGFVDRLLQGNGFVIELAANVNVGGVGAHGEGGEQAAFDQLMRVVAQNVAVFAGAGLALVGVDDEVMRAVADGLRHEGPLHAGREAGAAAATQAGGFHFVNNGIAAAGDDRRRAVPIAARTGAGQTGIMQAVEIGENPVLIAQHRVIPPVRS